MNATIIKINLYDSITKLVLDKDNESILYLNMHHTKINFRNYVETSTVDRSYVIMCIMPWKWNYLTLSITYTYDAIIRHNLYYY